MASDSFRLVIGAQRISAELARGGRVVWSGEAAYSGLEDLTDVLARLFAEPDLARPSSRVRVELDRPVAQCRTLTDLPPVTLAALRPMVEQQAHRYFRKNGKPLIVDAVRLNGPGSAIQATAVEEPIIMAISAGVRAAGLRLDDVSPSGYAGMLSLLLPEERERRLRQGKRSLLRLGQLIAVLWVLVAAASVISLTRQRRAIDRELSRLMEPVAALSAVRREVHMGQSMIDAVGNDGDTRGSVVRLLAGITTALPDSSFLTSLSLQKDGRGSLGGYGRRASEVLASLEGSGILLNPRLDGQLGREVIAGLEWERFSIAFGERAGQ
jgi:hypothetical protein